MQRSRLELYEEILCALVNKQLTFDAIAYVCNMDCIALHKRLEFLFQQGLIKERNTKNTTWYALTRRGIAISKTLALTKRLEKLQTAIKRIDDALQVVPSLSEYDVEKSKTQKRNKNY